MILKKSLSSSGFPVYNPSGSVSKAYQKAHIKANKAALERFGSRVAKDISRLVKACPEGELLGKHNRKGEVFVSKRVPPNLRAAVAFHERVEHREMMRKGGR